MLNLLGANEAAPRQVLAIFSNAGRLRGVDDTHRKGVRHVVELPPDVAVGRREGPVELPAIDEGGPGSRQRGGRTRAQVQVHESGGGTDQNDRLVLVVGFHVPVAAGGSRKRHHLLECAALENDAGIHGELAQELVVREHVLRRRVVSPHVPFGHVDGAQRPVLGEHAAEIDG